MARFINVLHHMHGVVCLLQLQILITQQLSSPNQLELLNQHVKNTIKMMKVYEKTDKKFNVLCAKLRSLTM